MVMTKSTPYCDCHKARTNHLNNNKGLKLERDVMVPTVLALRNEVEACDHCGYQVVWVRPIDSSVDVDKS